MIDLTRPVSCRQFAKMVGRAESAARKARDRGSIIKGYYEPTKQFIPEIAAREWGVEILPEYGGKPIVKKTVKPSIVKQPKPEKEIKVQTADEVVKEILHEKTKTLKNLDVTFEGDDDEGFLFTEEWPEEEELSDEISKPEAERRTAILRAQMLDLAYKEKRGQLVATDKIQTVLFAYGAEIRIACEGITNAVLDQVLAAATRHEAKRIIDEYIHEMLNGLADISARNL